MSTSTEPQEVIIFIPAFDAKEKDYYINHFLAVGLANRLDNHRVYLEPNEVKISGQTGRRFVSEPISKAKRNIDIYEIYWRDLIDDINEKSIRYRVFRGFYLLFYWLSASFKIGRISRTFFIQILGILFLITAWEYSTVTLALTAIGDDPSALGFQLPIELATMLAELGKTFGSWQLWLITGALLSILPVSANMIINLLDFMVHYAEDDAEKGLGSLRDRVRYRLMSVLDDALDEPSYDKITVLSHSLGTVLAVDLLADYRHSSSKKIKFITLGSPIKSLASVSSWMSNEVVKCLDNEFIEKWYDFHSGQDWLCTEVPVPPETENGKFQSTEISLKVSLAKQLSGESHCSYFFDKVVLEKIIE